MEYISVKQAAEKWGLSDRRVRVLCAEGKIDGVLRQGRAYIIPADTPKPVDGRTLRGMEIPEQFAAHFAKIDAMKAELDKQRPLTQSELQRLREEFMVEFTYNSNAIEGNTLTLKETAMVLSGVTIDRNGWFLNECNSDNGISITFSRRSSALLSSVVNKSSIDANLIFLVSFFILTPPLNLKFC